MDHTLPWLKYVDADDLDDDTVDFDDMDVESPSGEHLGEVDGFIVDSESGRPYYVVIDAGGWFKSKHFLMPVGHVRFDADVEALKADLTRDRVERFPGFNKDEFDKLTPADLKKFNDQTLQACALTRLYVLRSRAIFRGVEPSGIQLSGVVAQRSVGTATGPRRGGHDRGGNVGSGPVRIQSSGPRANQWWRTPTRVPISTAARSRATSSG